MNMLNPIELERFGAEKPEIRCCDWPGCNGDGEHRAPKSRNELKSYHWFCLDHVRRYNAGWNYYDGMTDAEVEADVRRDTVWHRPSWPLGGKNGNGGRKGDFPFTADDLNSGAVYLAGRTAGAVSELYDASDTEESEDLADSSRSDHYVDLLRHALTEVEAPTEQFVRLGLN